MSAEEKAPAELRRGEHARPLGEDGGQRDRPVPVRVVGDLHSSALGHFFQRLAAGLDDGGLLLRGRQPLPDESGFHAVGNAGRQLVRPEGHRRGGDPDSSGGCGDGSAEKGDGVGFLHGAAMLVHLPHSAQVHLQGPLVKYVRMKTLKQRTEEAIAEGFTVGQLAAAAGKTSAAASLWLNGSTKTIKADSAIGLEKLTGWRWEWWVTGKGERGDTKRADSEPTKSPLGEALELLGAALAQDMPDDVRQDVADLLAKLALRRGASRHQEELSELLRRKYLPLTQGDMSYVAHQVSHDAPETNLSSPLGLGGATDVGGEWTGKRVPGGTKRTDEQPTYRKAQVHPAKRVKK